MGVVRLTLAAPERRLGYGWHAGAHVEPGSAYAVRRVAAALASLARPRSDRLRGIGQPAPYDSRASTGSSIPTPTPDPADFVDAIDNPWLPLAPGTTWRYEVTEDAGRHETHRRSTVTDETAPRSPA